MNVVKCGRLPFYVIEEHVMDGVISLRITVGRLTSPGNLVLERTNSKHLIHRNLRIMGDVVVQFYVNAPVVRKQFMQEDHRLIKPLQIRIQAPAPSHDTPSAQSSSALW